MLGELPRCDRSKLVTIDSIALLRKQSLPQGLIYLPMDVVDSIVLELQELDYLRARNELDAGVINILNDRIVLKDQMISHQDLIIRNQDTIIVTYEESNALMREFFRKNSKSVSCIYYLLIGLGITTILTNIYLHKGQIERFISLINKWRESFFNKQ